MDECVEKMKLLCKARTEREWKNQDLRLETRVQSRIDTREK